MSKTKTHRPVPEDGKKQPRRKHAKHGRTNRNTDEKEWNPANSRIYQDDFLPPRPWHGDV